MMMMMMMMTMRSRCLTPACTWIPVVLLAMAAGTWQVSEGSLVMVNRGLRVKRGQSASLQVGALQFSVPQQKDGCKVEVVLNEPITQRVGRLTPQVFDCHYLADEVKYVHNGCPILKEDTVKLRLYRFTETDTYMEVFSLHVDVTEPDCSVIKLGPKALEVPEFYGLSGIIDGDVLSFHYERRSSVECTVHIDPHHTHLPAHGQLVTGEPDKATTRGDEPESFIPLLQQLDNKARAMCQSEDCLKGLKLVKITKVPCDDFLLMGVKYHHTDPPSPDLDYISITLDLKDTRSGSVYQSERAWLPVRVRGGAVANQPPRPSFMSAFILEVDQFVLTPLSTAALDAEDAETPRQRLVFNVTRPPAEGFVAHLSDHTRPVSSFTWLDLNDMLIAYQPPNCSHALRRNYEVEFVVHDFFFEKSPEITVHMSVRNAHTNAPRVSWNMGLSLLEGQSRPITWDQLQIVDNDNLNAVRVITVDGLQHGTLTVRGGKGFLFTISDIRAGVVHYHHDDSDTAKDFIVFRITDGRHQTRHKFPINVLPKDDSPPFLITNMLLELPEGTTALLRGSVLQAADMDSSDDYILYNITRLPQAGEIMKIPGPGLTGYPVNHFLQKDLSLSTVYYRHLGTEVFDDSFEVVLSDFHDPPNLSEPQVIVVHVEPVPDQPPKEVAGVSRCLVVKETEVVHLTRQHLHFVDQESPDSELTYTVTTPPFFIGPHSVDAGRLFLVDSIPKFTKDSSAPVLRLFTQHAVNFLKVAYMPPVMDIGPYPQHVQFVLSITNQLGRTVTGICFNITLVPVDNQAPEVRTSVLTVDEGSESRLGPEHLLLSDVDSMEDLLEVRLRTRPRHGALWLDGTLLEPGQAFTLQHLKSLKVRYNHDSSETVEDVIEFTATDGINSVDFVIEVKVRPVNDEVPVVASGLKPLLRCAEGEQVVLTAEYVYATDADSNNGSLAYLIARQPYHGVVLRSGAVVDRFLQAHLLAGEVSYKHTGQEIGLTPRHDTITLVISDEDSPLCCGGAGAAGPGTPFTDRRGAGPVRDSLPVYDLKITVFPVDSQPPTLTTGDMFVVDEGGTAPITVAHLRALDVDTALDTLVVSLVSPPQFGYIENVLPSPGFEKSNMGISIASFSYRDVMDGHVNYVQSRHQRMEPTADQFMVCVSDGARTSGHAPFYIIISPTNDEAPELLARNITVREGDVKELDPSVLDASDLDVPRDELRFSVVRGPRHGALVMDGGGSAVHRRREALQHTPVEDFTMTDLRSGMSLMYMHDDSENMEDSFSIQLTDGKHQLNRLVQVQVLPVNDQEPRVTRNNGVEVDPGEARLISSVTLCAQDDDTPSAHVLYVLESVPTQGLLQIKEEGAGDWVTLGAGQNCSQEAVDSNLLRYVHTAPHSGTGQHDFFVFHLLDGKNRSPSQHFHISIQDMEKGNIAIFTRPVKVSRGDRVVLTTDVLLATDGSDKPEELLYAVTHPPAHGHVEYVQHPGLAISTFSQMDVAANLVAYVHDNRASASVEIFQFVVSNGEASRNGTFEVRVEMVDRMLPSLTRNQGLAVPRGATVTLDPESLTLTDPDTPADALLYVLLEPPQYGRLLLNGTPLPPGGNFSQSSVQELEVSYSHGGGPSLIDRFTFTAADSSNRGFLLDGRLTTEPVFFTIQIKTLDTSAPEVVRLQAAWKAERLADGRSGIYLSSRELRAQDAHSREDELTYRVVRAPHFGYLENSVTGSFVHQRFSQVDLNRRIIVYIIDPSKEALSDSLEFTVSDPLGNTGPSHTLELQWSSVELGGSVYSVCEDQASVSLDILRKGNLAESSYVTVKMNEITATAGKDFLTSPSSLVQFDPGVSKRSWQVEISQDRLEEPEETFELSLVSPEGAVLGSVSTAHFTITDTGRGRCGVQRDRGLPILGGKEVKSQLYPQHGSIQLEKLPVDGQAQVVWTRGDNVPRTPARGDNVPQTPARGDNIPRTPARGDSIPRTPARGDNVPQTPARGDNVPQTPARGDNVPKPPPAAADLTKKKLRAMSNPKTIAPSSVLNNGTDVIYTYHGITNMQVEDDTSPSRKGRKANVRVVSRVLSGGGGGGQGQGQGVSRRSQGHTGLSAVAEAGPEPGRKATGPEQPGPFKGQMTVDTKPCVPELKGLLHFNHSMNRLFHCNGVSWKPWTPNDQMVSAQLCPQDWVFHGGYCYMLSAERKATWSTANRACKERYKGNLASVLSKADMNWLWDFSGRKPFWIGLNDGESRGRWEWVGREAVSYTNWRKTPPRSKTKGGSRKCVLVWRRAKWQIRDCKSSRGHRYVCSVKV